MESSSYRDLIETLLERHSRVRKAIESYRSRAAQRRTPAEAEPEGVCRRLRKLAELAEEGMARNEESAKLRECIVHAGDAGNLKQFDKTMEEHQSLVSMMEEVTRAADELQTGGGQDVGGPVRLAREFARSLERHLAKEDRFLLLVLARLRSAGASARAESGHGPQR